MDNDSVALIVFIIILIIACVIAYKIIRIMLKHKIEIITAFTGGLGSGKTALSVNLAKKLLNRNRRRLKRVVKWRKFRNRLLPWKLPLNTVFDEPILLSNIPVIVRKPSRILNWFRKLFHLKVKQPVYCHQLTKEMLLLQTAIPKGSVVLLDEIGAFASQFQFKDLNVIKVFDEFVRLFRHYYSIPTTKIEPYMVVNDQCSENINLVVRRRLNMVHNLSNFLVIGPLCFYYERIIAISEEIKTIDTRTGFENDTQDNSNFRWTWLFSKGCYDSHCYSERADRLPVTAITEYLRLKTNELLTCPSDEEKQYISLTSNAQDIKSFNELRKHKNKINQRVSNRW